MAGMLTVLARDDVTVPALRRIYDAYGAQAGFAAELISAARLLDAEIAWRAYWLLSHCAREHRLTDAELRRIAGIADEATHWISRARLCQLFAATGCPPEARAQLFPFLQRCCDDRLIVLRAWALSALYQFRDDPDYAAEIRGLVKNAKLDPGKAMQARLRRLGILPYFRAAMGRESPNARTPKAKESLKGRKTQKIFRELRKSARTSLR